MKHFTKLAFAASLAFILVAPASAQPTPTSNVATFLNNLAAISDAAALSIQIPGLQDPVGNACWSQLAPVQQLIKVHPLPVTLKIASDLEALRLAAIAMNQICANPNCGQMFLDLQNAAGALSPVPLPMSLASICSKVAVIGTTAVPVPPPTLIVVPSAPASTAAQAPAQKP